MEPTDITIEILEEIRTELHDGLQSLREEIRHGLRGVGGEIQSVREELQVVSARLDRFGRRQTEADDQLSAALVAIAGAMREVRDELRQDRALHLR